MAALGQQPKTLVVLEFPEANGTVGGVYYSVFFPVSEDGDGIYERLLEAHGADVPYGVDYR